jgi:DNA-directed RNA polymerase specialized sigma subunit
MEVILTDDEADKVLKFMYAMAYAQYIKDGYRLDFMAYEDEGMKAISACLANYDPSRGIPFAAYARARMYGAIQDTYKVQKHAAYDVSLDRMKDLNDEQNTTKELEYLPQTMKDGNQRYLVKTHKDKLTEPDFSDGIEHTNALEQRLRYLPPRLQQYAAWKLQGYEDREIAQKLGINPCYLSNSLKVYRNTGRLAKPQRRTLAA